MFCDKFNIFVGVKLNGYCEGYFDNGGGYVYGKTIEGFGKDWIVVRGEDNQVYLAEFDSTKEMLECISKWRQDED